jgi:hypothetical protein
MEELGVGRLLRKYGVMMWTGCVWFRIGSSGEVSEPSGSVKG